VSGKKLKWERPNNPKRNPTPSSESLGDSLRKIAECMIESPFCIYFLAKKKNIKRKLTRTQRKK
jgi:hypothetical protein